MTSSTLAPKQRTPTWEHQRSLTDLGRPLADITFTVVDLETTGTSAAQGAKITEIGAVKVRGGEVLGEFQTLVDPGESIPTFISSLTGISDAMVRSAPAISSVLPAFLEFAAGTVLVAHNAPFDIGFLKHEASAQGRDWPGFEVLDTVKVARRVITRDDAPNCKLSSLAHLFHAETTPNHRALADARATVDVLHGLMERVGGLGVQTLEELQAFSAKVSDAQRRKRHLADSLPHAPGVYLFRDARGEVLYVGTSKDLRARVRNYFTASETRTRIGEMVGLATSVEGIECATALEAEVQELRLIARHRPPYNRRSRNQWRTHFVKLTCEAWPRLSLVKKVLDDGATYLGPFTSRSVAEQSMTALHESFPIRQCSGKMAKSPTGTACVLAELGRCLAPCEGTVAADDYATVVAQVREAVLGDPEEVVSAHRERMGRLSAEERFEEAGTHRDRLATFLRASTRTQRLRGLTRVQELSAIRRRDDGRWEVHVIRHGRLAGSGLIPTGANAHTYLAQLCATAETVLAGLGPAPAASAEESEKVLRWLESPGVRLADTTDDWVCPVAGAGRHHDHVRAADDAGDRAAEVAAGGFGEVGLARTVHRPTR